MTDPMYLSCTAFAMFFVIVFSKYLIHLNNTFFIFDSIGLALFTVVGASKSLALGYPFWVAIIMEASPELPEVYCVTYSSTKFR